MAERHSPVSTAHAIGTVSLIGAFAVTATVIAGWVTAIPLLRSFVPGRVDMKLLTCLAAAAGATSLASLLHGGTRSRLSRALSGLVMTLSVLSLAEYALSREFGLLTFLSPDRGFNPETVHAGRMAPNTAVAFLTLSVCWLLIEAGERRFHAVVTGCFVTAGIIALLPITGVLYGAYDLRGAGTYSPMALPTAITLLLLAVSTAAFAAHRGFVPILMAKGPGGTLLRGLLPFAVTVPLLMGWLQTLGQKSGWYEPAVGAAGFSIAVVVVTIGLVMIMASILEREDARRRVADDMILNVAKVQQEIVTAPRDAQALMDLIARRSRELTGADGSVVEVAHGESMIYRATDGSSRAFQGMEIPMAGSLSGLAYQEARAVICDDTEVDPRVNREACRRIGARSMLLVPLTHGGMTVGVVKVHSALPGAFGAPHQRILQMMASLLGAVLSYSREFENREAAIAEQAAEIVDLRGRFESFVERSPAIAFMKDRNGYYLYGNAAFHRAIGDPDREVLGRTDDAWLSESAAAESRRRDAEVLSHGGESTTIDELTIGNEPRWWMVSRFRVSAGAEGVLGAVAIDVTERRRAEEEIRRLNVDLEQRVRARTEELQQANEQLESFSYSVSHDLRTPLRAIDGYSRMLQEDYGAALDDEARRLLGVIRTNTKRMGDLISDLLEFSRFSRRSVHPAVTDVAALAGTVARRLLASDGQERTIDLAIHEAPPATVDASMFEQVLSNLLSNAIKYTRDRDPARIDFRGWQDDGWLVYRIEDNGVGFDPRFGHKLFGVFQRLHHADEFEGTGVGLAIVKRIIERHGGRVWAESEVGKGSRFFVALPEKGVAADG